jgi:type VI secretion system secreted protein Hcp
MATNYFMNIDGIPGESVDKSHPNEIDVISWSWGTTTSATVVPNNAGVGAVQDLNFTARTSRASPLLFVNCATGTKSKSAVLVGRRDGAAPIEYLRITMTDVLISSYQVAGSAADNAPLEQVSLEFAKVTVSYTPQNANGTAGAPVVRSYDRATSKAI